MGVASRTLRAMTEEPIKPDAVQAMQAESNEPDEGPTGSVSQPTKLIRIASMTRAMLEEARQAPVDQRGRERLAEVHRQSVEEMRGVLSDDLLEEFDQVMVPLTSDGSTDAEIRIAQAQLIGWLEGLFHGIQATLFSQQVAAQNQLAEMQRRALGRGQQGNRQQDESSGLYL